MIKLNTKGHFGDIVGILSYEIKTRPRGYKTFSCSTQLRMKFILLIKVKTPTITTIVGVLTFICRINE